MRDHRRERGRDLLVRPEGDAGHRSSRARASATRKSSAVVTLRLYGESGTTSTGKPARSHSSASSVGTASSFRSRAYASSIIARGNPCGVCARHRRSLATVLVIRSSATSLIVSCSGTAATAPTPARARAITLSIVSRLTKGRAPSCTTTTLAPGGNARNPARTDWARAAPPGTRRRRSPSSFPSHSGGRSATPAGSATTTWLTAGCDVNGRSVRSSIGTPWMGRNCLGSPGPARSPAPAATITTPTSGGEATGEVTDPIHSDHVEIGDAGARARRQEDAPEPLAGRLGEPPLHPRHRPDLPAQPDLAQKQRVGRQRPVPHAREQRGRHGQVAGRLEQPHAAGHVDEHVQRGERHATAALEHREQDGEPAVIEARRDALWRAESGLRGERLDLHQHGPRPFHH